MRKLIIIAMLIQGCGNQLTINSSINASTGPCAGQAVGSWDAVNSTNVLNLNTSCGGTTTYCNEVFTYAAINSSTYQLTVSQTNGGPECLPIGQTNCTGGFIGDVLWLNCGAGKNLNSNYNRL